MSRLMFVIGVVVWLMMISANQCMVKMKRQTNSNEPIYVSDSDYDSDEANTTDLTKQQNQLTKLKCTGKLAGNYRRTKVQRQIGGIKFLALILGVELLASFPALKGDTLHIDKFHLYGDKYMTLTISVPGERDRGSTNLYLFGLEGLEEISREVDDCKQMTGQDIRKQIDELLNRMGTVKPEYYSSRTETSTKHVFLSLPADGKQQGTSKAGSESKVYKIHELLIKRLATDETESYNVPVIYEDIEEKIKPILQAYGILYLVFHL